MIRSYYIPNGPKNLQPLFPAVDFSLLSAYYVQVKDDGGNVVATGNINEFNGCCNEDKIRINFLNYAGAVDAINFKLLTIEQEAKSEGIEKPVQYPLEKPVHNVGRFNVKSNDTYTLINEDYGEEDKDWIEELFASPLAWMQWSGVQGQADSYIPIVIIDQKFEKVKQDEKYIYQVQLQFKLSHERFIIRN